MDTAPALISFAAGVLAGAMSAAAGGGFFVTIPAMVFADLPSIAANGFASARAKADATSWEASRAYAAATMASAVAARRR